MATTNRDVAAARAWSLLATLVFDNREPWRSNVSARIGLPFSRYRALRRLQDGPKSGSALARALDIDAPAASLIVQDLVERGLATREIDPADRRRRIITISNDGLALIADAMSGVIPVPALDGLDDAELAALEALLRKALGR